MANLFGYGSTSPMPMVPNHRLWFDDDSEKWILLGKAENATIRMEGQSQEEVIERWKAWVINNRIEELDPDFV